MSVSLIFFFGVLVGVGISFAFCLRLIRSVTSLERRFETLATAQEVAVLDERQRNVEAELQRQAGRKPSEREQELQEAFERRMATALSRAGEEFQRALDAQYADAVGKIDFTVVNYKKEISKGRRRKYNDKKAEVRPNPWRNLGDA